MKSNRMLLIASMAIFGISGIGLYIYFMDSTQTGPFHDNLVPELIGFTLEGFFLVGLLSVIQISRERARRKELWLSLRGSLRGILSNLDIAFLVPNSEPSPAAELERNPKIVEMFMKELQEHQLNLDSMSALKRESIEILSLMRDMIPVAAQLSAEHMSWWIAIVDCMRQLSEANDRENIERNVYLLLENIYEFDRLAY
jgi:hypothetical protein